MCIGIPLRVAQSEGLSAWCEGRGGRQRVNLALVGPQPPGTWLLTFLGSAREVVAEDEAQRVNRALDALEAVLRGEEVAVGEYFADLAGREPELPPHLRRGGGG
jgi:hydrogenase expression/formation protein HypC